MRSPGAPSIHSRVVVIGDSTVGKTSLLNRIAGRLFDPHERSTVVANFRICARDAGSASVELQIWDTAGQERFRALAPIYFRNAVAAVVVFDCTARATFEHLAQWISDFRDVAGPETAVLVTANKADAAEQRAVSRAEAQAWADSMDYAFIETSARTGDGVQELFDSLVRSVLALQAPRKTSRLPPFAAADGDRDGKCGC
jgi:small GTP-binding protein